MSCRWYSCPHHSWDHAHHELDNVAEKDTFDAYSYSAIFLAVPGAYQGRRRSRSRSRRQISCRFMSQDPGKWHPSASLLHHEFREADIYDSGEVGDHHCNESEEPFALETGNIRIAITS